MHVVPIPDFVVALRQHVGHNELWLPGVTAVVRRAETVLLVRRSDSGEWAPVTGILEPGEEPAVGAQREVLEETGVHALAGRLASTGVMRRVQYANGDIASYLDLTFACTWLAGEPYAADDESTEARWWPLDGLPDLLPVMRQRIAAACADEAAARFVR